MQTNAAASPHADLSTLSIDAALQLDKVERRQSADFSVLKRFVNCLESDGGSSRQGCSLNLQSNPLNVEIFNVAVHRAEDKSVESLGDLEAIFRAFIDKMKSISDGRDLEAAGGLKRFCLSLHEALLSEDAPFGNRDEWVLTRDERCA